jgi:hypothetical protein
LATNLRNRLKHHLKDRHGQAWDRFSVYLTVGDHLRELETLLLRIVRPSGNKQKGKFSGCEDLRRRFRRDMKQSALAAVDDVFNDPRPPRMERKPVIGNHTGRKAALVNYISGPFKLRARFKGRLVRARVRRDGTVRFDGKVYTSPSLAAAVACKRKTCNGWGFWQYERAPGDWVPLDTLRH